MIDLALWIFAIAAASMLAVSLASALGLRALGPLLDRVEPRARARIWTFAAFLPLVVAILVTGAVLLPHPWLGLPEHCFGHDDDHLHLCLAHGAPRGGRSGRHQKHASSSSSFGAAADTGAVVHDGSKSTFASVDLALGDRGGRARRAFFTGSTRWSA